MLEGRRARHRQGLVLRHARVSKRRTGPIWPIHPGARKSTAIMDTNRTGKKPGRASDPPKPDSVAQRRQRPRTVGKIHELTNAQLAELLARQAENARPPLTRAFRRASRRAFLWPEEASSLQKLGRSLTELQGIGPYLEKLIRTWFSDAPLPPSPPALRSGFLTFTQAQTILCHEARMDGEPKGRSPNAQSME